MIALNVTQMSKPSHSDVGYMATCSECGKRKRLMRQPAKYYVSPDARGQVWVLICKCGKSCVVDVSAQQSMHTDGACTCAEPDLYSDGGAEVFCRSCGNPPRW